ncbi:hypothetical protein [Gorillibacterium sp. sgz5001074]|uniref:hypothetical protein n=1 Tax=Gorillibacterium sp. sgz5001074 TaxID=3446695 RepID=UPI003F680C68
MDEKELNAAEGNDNGTNAQDEGNNLDEQVQAWFNMVKEIIGQQYPDYEVEGQIALHPNYGHLFAFRIKKEDMFYTCGFMLTELIRVFQNNGNPPLWLASFFYDMIQAGESRPLPNPPASEEEANQILQEKVLPLVMQGVQEEFSEAEQVYVDLDTNEQLGPVLELGIPSIKDGPNTCAIPLQYLLTMYMLNRDPAEHAVQNLSKILEARDETTAQA